MKSTASEPGLSNKNKEKIRGALSNNVWSSRQENKKATKTYKLHTQFSVGYPASSGFYIYLPVSLTLRRAVSGPRGGWGGSNPHVREGDARRKFRIRGDQSGRGSGFIWPRRDLLETTLQHSMTAFVSVYLYRGSWILEHVNAKIGVVQKLHRYHHLHKS